MRLGLATLALCLGLALPLRVGAQTPAPPQTDGLRVLLTRLERLLQTNDRDAFPEMLSTTAVTGDQAIQATDDLFSYDSTRAVLVERDRQPLMSAPPGDGFRVIAEILIETSTRARVMTARFDVRRPPGGDADSWRIVDVERLTLVQGLYRLRIDTENQFDAQEFSIEAQDVRFTLHSGSVFHVLSGDGITGIIMLGRGEMRFAPAPATERGQLRILTGSDTMTASFGAAFVRLHPADYETHVNEGQLRRVAPSPRLVRRAQDVFATEAPKSFNIDLRDLSREQWYILPQQGDSVAEVRTSRFGVLTYARSAANPEDVTLFDRAHKRTIALYPSPEALAARGAIYNEDDFRTFDVLDYNIDTLIDPDRQFVDGKTQVTLRITAEAVATITFRLAESLAVTSVVSNEFGRLLFFRVKNDDHVIVNLPVSAQRGNVVTMTLTYVGRLEPERLDREALALEPQGPDDTEPPLLLEPNYLLSSRSAWYPQNIVSDYARARIRVRVPPSYTVVASGRATPGDVSLADAALSNGGRASVFYANEPVRYFSVVVSRLTRVFDATVPARDAALARFATHETTARPGVRVRVYDQLAVSVDANPRLEGAGRALGPIASDIMRFYGSILDDTPYDALTVTMLEHDLPGGHSPAYFSIVNTAAPLSRLYWGNDPAAFTGIPEYFAAHEMAHQWWGQAVGWKNYHEQWISEGFAQYFAALYARQAHGEDAFTSMLRQFRRWSLSQSNEGPVDLGYRLGLIQGEGRIFRALVYNKGAAVLHMLRNLLGDERFFNGLRQFYGDQKFQKAGTDDFQRAMETASGQSLQRFFDRWIRGSEIPTVRYVTRIQADGVFIQFDQDPGTIFDIPVTVTLGFADGHSQNVVIQVTDAHVERVIPAAGVVKDVEVNRDSAALARLDEQ